jgi:outer membrane protein TolC
MMHADFATGRTWSSAVFATLMLALAMPAGAQTNDSRTPTPVPALHLSQTPAPVSQTPGGDTLQLTMDQAVQMALQTNLGIKSDRMSLDLAAQQISGARVSFLPQLTSSLGRTTQKQQPTDFTLGSTDISRHSVSSSTNFVQNLPWFGTRYSANWQAGRTSTIGGNSTFNPQLGSTLILGVNQPLWNGFRIDQNRYQLQSAERNRAIVDTQLQQRLLATEANVRQSYLTLVTAIQFRQVAQQNLDVGNAQLRAARARVGVGQGAPIDVISAEATVSGLEEQLIAAEANISTAEDILRTLVVDPARPDFWAVHIVPTDDMQVSPKDLDAAAEEAAIKAAIANRLDAAAAKQNIEQTDLNMRLQENLTKPTVNLQAQYTSVGNGGTLLQYGSEGFPPPVIGRTDRSFGAALNDTLLGAYPTWNLQVVASYPIGRTGAQVALAQDEIQKAQQTTDLHALEIQIVQQVRDAARQVRTSIQRMQAADAALQSSQKQADAKQESFDVGLTGLFELQNAQQQLANAKQNAVQARLSYIQALIRFDAVQKIPQ